MRNPSDQIEATLGDASALIEAMDARGLAPFVHVERAQLKNNFTTEARRHGVRQVREAVKRIDRNPM